MTNTIKDLLLIQSFNLDNLIEEYRLFFLAILPSVFILACLIEYFDRMNVFELVKRAFIAVLILTTVASFYKVSIDYSMDAANEKLEDQKQGNVLLMDLFDAIKHWDKLQSDKKGQTFYKNRNAVWGTLAFLKYHMFEKFINDGFTLTVFFIAKLCFVILKVVYSLVYYLGYGLIGIPVIIYMFPTMGNVLRGGVLSYLWCLVVPHVLVFVLSMISSEINKGYLTGQIIGGSAIGTALLFVLTLFVAFTPLITMMILNGSGISQAGGIIATIGANYIMNLPKNAANTGATMLTGGTLGPKMMLAQSATKGGFKLAKNANIYGGAKQTGILGSKLGEGVLLKGVTEDISKSSNSFNELSSSSKQQVNSNNSKVTDQNHKSSYMKKTDGIQFSEKKSSSSSRLSSANIRETKQDFKTTNSQRSKIENRRNSESVSERRKRDTRLKKTT